MDEKNNSQSIDCPRAEDILRIALDIGGAILKSGGEINRVEDTVSRICRAYGAKHIEIFAIPSVMVAAIRLGNEDYSSQVRRIDNVSNDLYKLELYNSISRKICAKTPEIQEVDKMISEAKGKKPYPWWLCLVGAILAAGGFAVFFGGDIFDGIVAGIIAVPIYFIDSLPFKRVNRLAKTVMQSFLGGVLALLAVILGLGSHEGMIMIGTIMLLIPGLSFGTAFRDLLCGDFLAGTLKTVQCLLAALMIAAGYLLSMFLLGGFI